MDIAEINGLTVMFAPAAGPTLASEQDALDLIGETYGSAVDAIAVPVERFGPGFFDLSTRQAGLFIQKFQNYQLRLVVLGDLSAAMKNSKALSDFVGETNRIGHHFFALDRADFEAQFGRSA
jgi:hypothetical protein